VSESPTEPTPERLPATPLPADEAPTEAAPGDPKGSAPTEALAPSPEPESRASSPAPPTPGAPAGQGGSRGRALVVGILVLVLGAGAGFLLGRSTADSGPTTLAAAVDETVTGDLPTGDLSLDQLLGAARQQLGSGEGGLGGLLGGNGRDAGDGVLGQILDQLGERLGNRFGGGSTTPDGASAFLGVATGAAPSGQAGARVDRVAPDGPAADAGLRVGDVVTAVDGAAVADPAALVRAVSSRQPGDQITLTLTRDGASTDVKVRLGNTDASKGAPATTPTTRTT
jgi:PDZ domain